jgi:hypothetical protein
MHTHRHQVETTADQRAADRTRLHSFRKAQTQRVAERNRSKQREAQRAARRRLAEL